MNALGIKTLVKFGCEQAGVDKANLSKFLHSVNHSEACSFRCRHRKTIIAEHVQKTLELLRVSC